MTRFENSRERRGSCRVSTNSGSPIAASIRSAAEAYALGSRRHNCRYSSKDISDSWVAEYLALKPSTSVGITCLLQKLSSFLPPSPLFLPVFDVSIRFKSTTVHRNDSLHASLFRSVSTS